MWRRKKKSKGVDRVEIETPNGKTILARGTSKEELFEALERIFEEEIPKANKRMKKIKVGHDVDIYDTTSKIENRVNNLMRDAEGREKLNELFMKCKDIPEEEVMDSIITVISAYMKGNAGKIGKYCFILTPPKTDYHENDIHIASNFNNTEELKDFVSHILSLLNEEGNEE